MRQIGTKEKLHTLCFDSKSRPVEETFGQRWSSCLERRTKRGEETVTKGGRAHSSPRQAEEANKFKAKIRSRRGNSLRSIPFVMSGHLIFNFFQTLGLPIFNTNPNNGCPKRIYQHSGQAHKHFSHRFHGVSFLADVQTWRSKQKFVFIATNPPQYQNFCTQCTKIITSVSNDIAR